MATSTMYLGSNLFRARQVSQEPEIAPLESVRIDTFEGKEAAKSGNKVIR